MEYEDRLQISTPEGVELELTLAGIGSRFTAGLIDFTIQSLLVAAGIALLLGVGDAVVDDAGLRPDEDASEALGVAILSIYSFLIFFAYDVLFEVRGGGRTPGKRLTGLRVVRTGGRPVGFVTSAIRNVLRLVDFLPSAYGLGMAVVFASKRNQRLGDIAAGTVVVRERKGGRRAPTPAEPTGISVDASGWDVSGVSAEEIATVRRFLERRGDLLPDARRRLASDLTARLLPKVAGAPPGTEVEAFLEALSAAKAARA